MSSFRQRIVLLVIREKLTQGQATETGFSEVSTVWHFATNCASVKFVEP